MEPFTTCLLPIYYLEVLIMAYHHHDLRPGVRSPRQRHPELKEGGRSDPLVGEYPPCKSSLRRISVPVLSHNLGIILVSETSQSHRIPIVSTSS